MPASSAQAHADPAVFAETAAGMQEAQAYLSYQKEKTWVQDTAGKYEFIHLFLRDLFCLQCMIFTETLEWRVPQLGQGATTDCPSE